MPTRCPHRSRAQSDRAGLLSRSLQEISPVSPDRGYYWARDSRHSPFPSQLFALGNTKNCCSGLNCADNCTRSGRGLCPPDSMGGPEMKNILCQLWREQKGQDIAEYAVMLAVILVIVVGTIRLIGSNANNVFSSVASSVQ